MSSYESLVQVDFNELRVRIDAKYEGERNAGGERHGYGQALLPSGDIYKGTYLNGKRDGYGVYKFFNKARYEGEYKDNKRCGQGVMYFPDGSVYDGEWKNNKRSGHGRYTYVNGDTYEGEWKLGSKHGQGTYTYHGLGLAYKGKWEFGKFEGQAELHTPCYVFYGQFSEDEPRGPGRFSFKSGCDQTGAYINKRTVSRGSDGDGYSVQFQPTWVCTGLRHALTV